MELRGECEPDAHLGDRSGDVSRRQVDPHAQGFQGVGTTGQRRRRPVPVLDHRHSACGDDDRRHRGQVHGVGAVASGPHDVDDIGADRRERVRGPFSGVAQHHVGELRHLRGGRPLHLHRDGECSDLRRGRGTGHDLVHCPPRLTHGKVLAGGQPAQDLGPLGPVGDRFLMGIGGWHEPDYDQCRHPGGVQQLQSVILTAYGIAARTRSMMPRYFSAR